ncbi:MAG: hypothetical protein ACI81L_000904 [Verrucomicrobiales bacterium]|jgi:hypothetical protein
MTDDVAVSTEIQVDDETRAALLLFNERVEANAAAERGAKRLAKAERAKDEAVAAVRKNANASAEDQAAAEATYKAAVENFQAIQADPLAGLDAPRAKAPVDEPTEVSADDEVPAAVAEAPSESE